MKQVWPQTAKKHLNFKMTSDYHGNQVINVELSFEQNAKEKSENRHTWLTIPSKYVYQISEINILVCCTNFALYERIRKHKLYKRAKWP